MAVKRQDVQDYKSLYDDGKKERAYEEQLWQLVYDFCFARPVDVTTGERKNTPRKADSIGILLLNQLTNHLAGSLTNPMTRWFRLGASEYDLMGNKAVNDWFEKSSDIIIHHINQSNFYDEIKKCYRELGATGNVCMFVTEGTKSDDDLFNFSARGVYDYVIYEDKYGKVNTVISSINYTGRRILNAWGKELSRKARSMCEAEPTKKFKILHVIEPRKLIEDKSDKKNKPIKSVWIFYETNEVIDEDGFDDFPAAIGRINKDATSEYGVGFGVQALRELQTLNMVRTDTLKVKRLQVDPPLLIPDGALLSPATIEPGQKILYRPMNGRSEPKPFLNGGQTALGDQETERSIQVLKELFFNDALQITDTRYETREGVMQRADTQQRLLAGTVSELQNDMFERIVMRCFFIAARRGLLPPMPEQLVNKRFRPIWLSPLALRSREATLDPLVRSIQQINLVAQTLAADVEGIDTINKDAVIRRVWESNGAPSDCLYDKGYVEKMRKDRQQAALDAMQTQQALMGMNSLADAEAKTANTNGVVGKAMRKMGKAVANE